MTSPEISVSITDTEFSIGEIQDFLDTARGIDGMPGNALVRAEIGATEFPAMVTLIASTGYRSKGETVELPRRAKAKRGGADG